MLTLQNSFNPLLLGGGGGRKIRMEVTVNKKEENSYYDFCPNYVQEFGLRTFPQELIVSPAEGHSTSTTSDN
jgi:hypothetical protein